MHRVQLHESLLIHKTSHKPFHACATRNWIIGRKEKKPNQVAKAICSILSLAVVYASMYMIIFIVRDFSVKSDAFVKLQIWLRTTLWMWNGRRENWLHVNTASSWKWNVCKQFESLLAPHITHFGKEMISLRIESLSYKNCPAINLRQLLNCCVLLPG